MFTDERFIITPQFYDGKITFSILSKTKRYWAIISLGFVICPLGMPLNDYISRIEKVLQGRSLTFLYDFQRSKYSFSKWLRAELIDRGEYNG